MRIFFITALCLVGFSAFAQGTGVAFGGFGYSQDLPVEITADALDINQTTGTASFNGNVIIGQGEMRLSAATVVVEYGDDADGKSEIKRLIADGGVTLVGATEAAEAQRAEYSVIDGAIILTGSVLVTQGPAAISGDRLLVNLETGNGSVEGNVRTLLNTGSDN